MSCACDACVEHPSECLGKAVVGFYRNIAQVKQCLGTYSNNAVYISEVEIYKSIANENDIKNIAYKYDIKNIAYENDIVA